MELGIILVSLIMVGLIVGFKKIFSKFNVNLLMKILVVTYFIVGFMRLFLPDDFLLVINGAYDYNQYFDKTDYLTSFLRWGYQTSLIVLPICAFFHKNKYIKRIIVFYCLPMLIANILTFDTYMVYFLTREVLNVRFNDPFGVGNLSDNFRIWQLAIEFTLALVIELYSATDLTIYKMKKKEILNFVGLLIPIIIFTIPIYVPQSLFGYGTLKLTGFSLQNYIWILVMVIMTFIIYFIFRFQSKENRYIVCLFFAINLFVLYNNFYITGVTISRLPLQLCNLGCYLVLLAMITKSQKLFDFIFIANIVGTIIAIMVPDASSWKGVFSFFDFHFMYEHMMLFILPILMLSLKIFDRPNIKGLRNALVGFTIYFMFCWICGLYLNSISDKTGVTVNYFYIFKTDVLDALPFLGFTRKIHFTWGNYICYPLYQFMIYLLYCGCCIALYYLSFKFYKIADDHKKLRLIRIKEWEEKTGLVYPRNLDFTVEPTGNNNKGMYRCYKEKYMNYFNFEGEVSALDYWKTVLVDVINLLIYVFLLVVGYFIFRDTGNLDKFNMILNILLIIYLLINLLPSISILIRRLNSVNKSWKYSLLIVIPIVGWIYLIVILVDEGKEETVNA